MVHALRVFLCVVGWLIRLLCMRYLITTTTTTTAHKRKLIVLNRIIAAGVCQKREREGTTKSNRNTCAVSTFVQRSSSAKLECGTFPTAIDSAAARKMM